MNQSITSTAPSKSNGQNKPGRFVRQPGRPGSRRQAFRRAGQQISSLVVMVTGVLLAALGYSLFQVPYHIAAGGVGGISIIVNSFTGWPVGAIYLVLNIPLLVLGYFHLGRWAFIIRTLIAVLVFSTAADLFLAYLPGMLETYPITQNVLLSAIYGGLVGGIGGGLNYRAGGTMGGTAIIGRIIQKKTGFPLSQVYLYTDGIIVLTAGAVFGWELALYALLTLFLTGMVSDYTLEGPSSVRTATIITNNPEPVAQALINELGRGVSQWQVTGSYTGETRTMLTCTIYRPQVNDLKRIVGQADARAFVTIGVGHQAFGAGFSPLKH